MSRHDAGDSPTGQRRGASTGVGRTVRLATALLSGIALIAAGSASPGPFQQSTKTSLLDDPLALFGKLMPVFTHPRCFNCHGNTNPFTGDQNNPVRNHPFDVDASDATGPFVNSTGDHIRGRNAPCLTCHDDPGATEWRLAPTRMDFRNRTALALCRQFRAELKTSDAFMTHLRTDPLQAMAFLGRKGILPGGQGDPAEEPPMKQPEFFQKAEEWLKGHSDLPCSGWVGTITQTETVDLRTGATPNFSAPGIVETESQVATRTMTITVGGPGGMTAAINVSGSHGIETTITVENCTATNRDINTYRGNTSGPVQAASLTFGFAGGAYSLDITGPVERTTTVHEISGVLCQLGPSSDTTTTNFTHHAWTVRIRGVLPDNDRTFTRLEGKDSRTVTENNDQSWFHSVSPNVTPLQAGQPVPVTVTTTWDLRLATELGP